MKFEDFIIDENDKLITLKEVAPPWKIIRQNCVGPCFLYSRQIYNQLGQYNPEAILAEDYDYWLRVHKHFKMARINKELYYYRLHPESLTGHLGHDEAYRMAEKVRKSYVTILDLFQYELFLFMILIIKTGKESKIMFKTCTWFS